eukprot:353775-Chlamydomonas_euryale.AAC.3
MVPSPGCAGVLGRAFIDCFSAVELRFTTDAPRTIATATQRLLGGGGGGGGPGGASGGGMVAAALAPQQDTAVEDAASLAAEEDASSPDRGEGRSPAPDAPEPPPSTNEFRFHAQYDAAAAVAAGRPAVTMGVLGTTGLWGVTLRVTRDGAEVDMPCLVDTGSPITVLNSAAAAALRVGPSAPAKAEPEGEKVCGYGGVKSTAGEKEEGGSIVQSNISPSYRHRRWRAGHWKGAGAVCAWKCETRRKIHAQDTPQHPPPSLSVPRVESLPVPHIEPVS